MASGFSDPYSNIEDYDDYWTRKKEAPTMKYLTRDIYDDHGRKVPQGTYLYPRDHIRNSPNKVLCMYRTGAEEGTPQQHTIFVPTAYIGNRDETDDDADWEGR